MKILHICSHDRGGAAQAAIRFHEQTLRQKIESSILFIGPKSKNIVNSHYIFYGERDSKISKTLKTFNFKQTTEERLKDNLLKTRKKSKYECFSFSTSSLDITETKVYQQADIIHLHWVGGLLDYPSFFEKNQKPVFWTLHDMNPFLGGFHYQGDVERNRDNIELMQLSDEVLYMREKALSIFKNLTLITPSNWLCQISKASSLFKNYPHFHIKNGLDTNIFRHYEQSFAKSIFGMPTDKKVFLFVSDRLSNYRKGMDLLQTALNAMSLDKEIMLCALGEGAFTIGNSNIQSLTLDSINDERLISLLYAAADFVIIPSREDNLPNVMIEAMSCGTPVISFSIGGLAEVIRTGENGILAKDISADGLKEAIEDAIHEKYPFNRQAIIQRAHQEFDIVAQTTKYIELYQAAM